MIHAWLRTLFFTFALEFALQKVYEIKAISTYYLFVFFARDNYGHYVLDVFFLVDNDLHDWI